MVYYGGLEYFISRELDTISSSGNKAIPGKITTFVLQLPHFRLTYIASVFKPFSLNFNTITVTGWYTMWRVA